MIYWGNKENLKFYKTGFLSSWKCLASIVLKSYDWAKEQRKNGNCIVCSNHSQIEKDVFEIFLSRKQPLILVIPRSMKVRWEPPILEAVNNKRLLIISPFENTFKRVTRKTAEKKNKTIIEINDQIVVGYKTKNGQLESLLNGKEHECL